MNRDRDFRHTFKMPKFINQWQVNQWCEEHFGKRWSPVDNREGVWCCFWLGFRVEDYSGGYKWLFKNESDAMLFALRWIGN